MSQKDAAGEEAAAPTYLGYEHPLVWDYVGKGRYLQVAVSKTIVDLYVRKFRKYTAKKLTNMAAEDGSLSLLEWSRGQGCNWNESVFLSGAKGGHIQVMRLLLTDTRLVLPRDARACAAAASRGRKKAIKWLRCCGFSWDASTCTAASSGGHLGLLIWAHFDCLCPLNPVDVCRVAARNSHYHILTEMHDRGVQRSAEVCVGAVEGGSLAMLMWLRERQYPWDEGVCWAAVKNGNLDILRYSVDNRCPFPVDEVMPGTQESSLCFAARKNYAEMAVFLLHKCRGDPGIINLANAEGRTALSLASGNGNLSLVELLVLAGADLEKATLEGWPPLYWAVSGNKVAVVEYLIGAGASVNFSEQTNGYTPLHVCSIYNYAKVAKLLVDNGAELDRRDSGGFTPLFKTVIHNSLKVAQILIDSGADISHIDRYGRTMLHRAVRERDALLARAVAGTSFADPLKTKAVIADNLELIKKFVSAGADVNLADASAEAPLHVVLRNEDVEAVAFLIEAGAKLNTVNKQGRTALSVAALANNPKGVKQLINAGADGDLADANGDTPLSSAVRIRALDVAYHLLEGGVDPNIPDFRNITPLARAVFANSLELVKKLVSAGAHVNSGYFYGGGELYRVEIYRLTGAEGLINVDAKALADTDKVGSTSWKFQEVHVKNPLTVAASLGYIDLVRYLLDAGATLEAAGGAHRLLIHAVRGGSVEVIKALGLDVNLVDNEGITLLTALAEAGRKEEVELLVKAGATVDIVGAMTALFITEDKGQADKGCVLMPASVPEMSSGELFSIGASGSSNKGGKRSARKR